MAQTARRGKQDDCSNSVGRGRDRFVDRRAIRASTFTGGLPGFGLAPSADSCAGSLDDALIRERVGERRPDRSDAVPDSPPSAPAGLRSASSWAEIIAIALVGRARHLRDPVCALVGSWRSLANGRTVLVRPWR